MIIFTNYIPNVNNRIKLISISLYRIIILGTLIQIIQKSKTYRLNFYIIVTILTNIKK